MNNQTPEQVAAAALAAEGYADWYRPYQEQVLATIAAAVRDDRAARDEVAAVPAPAPAPAPADDGDPMIAARRMHTSALTRRARAREALGEARASGLPTTRLQTDLEKAELAETNARIAYERIVRANRDDRDCDRCGESVLTLSSRDWCDGCEEEVDGLERCPNCGEYVDPDDMSHWPNLREPVSMCSSCEHNARRSGWEPGA